MTHTTNRGSARAARDQGQQRDRKRGSAAKAETMRRRQARADKRGAR